MTTMPMQGGYSVAPKAAADNKWCTGCKAYHPHDDFNRNYSKHDGMQAWCRNFAKAYHARQPAKEPK